MKNKLLIGFVINRFLVGALAPMSLTKNFNIIANGNDLFFAPDSGTEAMRIDQNGNLGIGKMSPASKLEVAGTFNATSSGGSLRVDSSGNIQIGL